MCLRDHDLFYFTVKMPFYCCDAGSPTNGSNNVFLFNDLSHFLQK